MDAVDLLKEQHRVVDQLFSRFEKSKRLEEKQKIFLEIAARLVGHDAIEREIFYPACERALGKTEPLMEGIAEHGLVEFSIFRADKARGKDTFEYLVSVLKEIVEHHVEEEEAELLPEAARQMGEEVLAELGSVMAERFDASMERDFRTPLRKNLQQVLAGRTKTVPPTRTTRTARAGARKRIARGKVAGKTGARAKRQAGRSGR